MVKQSGGNNVAHGEGDFEVVQRQIGQLVFDGGRVVGGHDEFARVAVAVAARYRDQGDVSAVAMTERPLNGPTDIRLPAGQREFDDNIAWSMIKLIWSPAASAALCRVLNWSNRENVLSITGRIVARTNVPAAVPE